MCANIDNINVNSPTSTSCVDTSITTTPVQNDDPERKGNTYLGVWFIALQMGVWFHSLKGVGVVL